MKAGKLLLSEIDGCLRDGKSFGPESSLSGHAQVEILKRANSLGYRIEISYLWVPSPSEAIKRIAQRVKKGGHTIPDADVKRRFKRSIENFARIYAPLADSWKVWDNSTRPAELTLSSQHATHEQLENHFLP